MQWRDFPPALWFPVAAVFLLVLVAIAHSRASKRLLERLNLMAREMGWSEVTSSNFLFTGLQGVWNGFNVKVRQFPRQKSVPERLMATIRIQAPARVTITRRQRGLFSGRPLSLFGPPVVDLPMYGQFWIRADEITIIERLMRGSAAAMLDRMLQSRYDVLKMRGDELSIQRVSARNPDEVARLAREELELLRAVIDALSLRP